ncbi:MULTISPECIES: response regulator transcription factor [unclassified Bacillus (in: firmicutes)]|uniref:response regulator transcription factor n=1 Tax=unclassified Bacillus (in: firmicutes) TaxID=185979 RepID=UPI001BE92A1E|nr:MULTISPECIES: response regulator transcription factor [unclassified Bacillus (in: firmicutes)]MBT2636455.1 response regulator transcription factor [Bacillus sp. ISL-39]MBT2660720.1 response regulator transcription factor [Bacillus sp. ISL-45]
MATILLVDDETRMVDLLALYLTPLGYKCIKKTSGSEAISFLENDNADLVLLDVMMPEMDGWETCNEIRKHWDIPVIMLTARSEKPDIVRGLKIGADDYITKPFDEGELVARIEAVLRRQTAQSPLLSFNGLKLNIDSYDVQFNGTLIPLTPKEFALLSLFLQNVNKVFTREHLISTIWGYGVDTEDRTIDSHVRNLRDKLRKSGFAADNHLSTVWGVGYKWVD